MLFTSTNIVVKLLLLALQFQLVLSLENANDDSISLNFEDNIDGRFSSFSKTNLRLSRQANLDVTPSRSISSQQYERLIDFPSDHPYYTLQVHFKRGAIQDYVMTSVPMCLVLQARFQYSVTLFINENGYIVGVQITTGNSTCDLPSLNEAKKKSDQEYKVTMRLQLNDVGPQPETQQFLEKLRRQQEAKANLQDNDNRSFILKYWKYLLPIAVIFVLQTAFTSDAGGPAAGGGQ